MSRNNAPNTFLRIRTRKDSGILIAECQSCNWRQRGCAQAAKRRSCSIGGASKASQSPPLTGTLFYSLLVGAFKRYLAPKGTLQYSRHQAFPSADLSWKLRRRF
jgi:hypothetical protein